VAHSDSRSNFVFAVLGAQFFLFSKEDFTWIAAPDFLTKGFVSD
jgi:hypothetical protein